MDRIRPASIKRSCQNNEIPLKCLPLSTGGLVETSIPLSTLSITSCLSSCASDKEGLCLFIKKSGVETRLRSRGERKRPLLSQVVTISVAPCDEPTVPMRNALHDSLPRRDIEVA